MAGIGGARAMHNKHLKKQVEKVFSYKNDEACRDGSAKKVLKQKSIYAAKQGIMACNNNNTHNLIKYKCREGLYTHVIIVA